MGTIVYLIVADKYCKKPMNSESYLSFSLLLGLLSFFAAINLF